MKQKSYIMIKPEFANKSIIILLVKEKLASNGIKIEEEGYIQYDVPRARQHYHEHVNKPFYPELEQYLTSDKAYGMVVSGDNAIAKIRALCGSTKNPEKGTIRRNIPRLLNMPISTTKNVVHSSDSPEAADLEIAIFHELKNKYLNSNKTK